MKKPLSVDWNNDRKMNKVNDMPVFKSEKLLTWLLECYILILLFNIARISSIQWVN